LTYRNRILISVMIRFIEFFVKMRQSHAPGSAGRRLAAVVCLLAVVSLWSPLWATAWQANGMACCNGGLCPAHGKHPLTIPAQNAPEECERHGGISEPTGSMNCTLSCCQETPASFTGALLFLMPQPTILSQPDHSAATISVLPPSEFFQSLEPLAPPPRAASFSL
jgi:hypothetical protein